MYLVYWYEYNNNDILGLILGLSNMTQRMLKEYLRTTIKLDINITLLY